MRRALVTAISFILLPAAAHAGLVEPGETVSLSSGDYGLPSGSLLAEKSVPFSIEYGEDADVGFDGMLQGTMRSAVYENGGKLSFLYDVKFTPSSFISGATEESDLWVQNFSGFKTSVTGMFAYEEAFKSVRSQDGSQIVLFSDTPGLGGAPSLLITTDAMAYDMDGLATFYTSDEVDTIDGTRRVSGMARLGGIYQPTLGDGQPIPSPDKPPTAIPLPPAAYSALGVMLGMGLIMGMRRVWEPKNA